MTTTMAPVFAPSVVVPAPTVSPSVVATPACTGPCRRVYPITVVRGAPVVRAFDPQRAFAAQPPAVAGVVGAAPAAMPADTLMQAVWRQTMIAAVGAAVGVGTQWLASERLVGIARFSPVALSGLAYLLSPPSARGDFLRAATFAAAAAALLHEAVYPRAGWRPLANVPADDSRRPF